MKNILEKPVLFKEKKECCGCTACFSVCPMKAISMVRDDEGFDYPLIDENICICCYQCMQVCPFKNVSKVDSSALYSEKTE